MTYDFTPSAQRALRIAAQCVGGDESQRQALLLGFLVEDESRAASMLARHGIDRVKLTDRWPDCANFVDAARSFAGAPDGRVHPGLAVMDDLEGISSLLTEMPHPLEISTEHLLLAIVGSSSDVGDWLRSHGMSPNALAAEIYRLHNVTPGPLTAQEDEATELFASVALTSCSDDSVVCTRILDASGNRALEALRVIEDYVRFGLDDAFLSLQTKELRHDLAAALQAMPVARRLAARDTQRDVGTDISTKSEFQRESGADILNANFYRLQQSLRSLEEFSKVEHAEAARTIESLRYRSYTLQRAVGITGESKNRLQTSRLYVLLDGQENLPAFQRLASTLVEAGADILQLRDKSLCDRDLLERANLLREVTKPSPTLFIMNDRPDLAALSHADGVHVGQEELSVSEVRRIAGLDMLIGVSTHTIDQSRQAVLDGANYIGVGPTFPSRTKQFDEFAGLDFAREVAAEISLPAFAIGGVDTTNVQQVIDAGISRIAVSAAVVGSSDPARAVNELLASLRRQDTVDSA